ncbi:DUF262 domain-containing protein [Candidatus Marithrix sp. Canyon 246]|uniref:DUF262 domain-containing protein n=1 Tax=Candidatus Marithrix sp. Canyon 246 TaxID=1827136 RepID=UPI001C0B3EAC|nr:DUF262 domain-containing protein [Candidatus Marithrix sp. Canyon 246]
MSNFMLMPPSNQTFAELFSNGTKYKVPRFQRDYAWDQEQWEDLWIDIQALDKEDSHYMGYIVLLKTGEHEFEIIDGQQRLITLSLIVIAVMRIIQYFINDGIDKEKNRQRLAVWSDRFLGTKSAITLIVENKLSLNRNNHRHFSKIASNLETLKEIGLSKTNVLLNTAFDFFVSKFTSKNATELAIFIEKLADKIFFTKIITQDSINAYKIFETLNARGIQLSTPDLLKNHIFSTLTQNDDVTDNHLNKLDEDWSVIISQLGENNFTDFISYHHNIQKPLVSKRGLFKSIQQIVTKPIDASHYLKSLGDYAPVYAALLKPHDEWWNTYSNEKEKIIHYLEGFKLFKIKQPFSMLMAAIYRKFADQELIKLLKYLYILSIRYNVVCRFSPNEQDNAYNKIAMKVFDRTYTRASHIKNCDEFKSLYPDDNTFKSAFEYFKLPSRQSSKKLRFLLVEIENNFGRSLNYLDVRLEHICPYNPEQEWHKHFGEGIFDISDRLGNMVLLEKDELKRADFATKKSAYLETNFNLAKKVAEYDSWDLGTLYHYQTWLAKQAVKTWRVD